jgi:hypothetical protein
VTSNEGGPTSVGDCALEGDATNPRVRALNLLKNRATSPTPKEIDTTITLAAMLAPGDDHMRFTSSKGVVVRGYVADVKVGGVETVNCHAKAPADRDTHIELTLTPNDADEATHVIVEVTPRWRAMVRPDGSDWSTPALRKWLVGRWVEVTGWLLYDEEHEANAAHTQRGRAKVWRATAWEVHPITGLRVVEGRR